MKNDANIRNFIEYLGNLHGKSWKICGKSFHFFPFLSISFHNLFRMTRFSRSFSVVFGRFCGHSWRKSENIGEKWRISGKSFHFFPLHYTFIPFYSSTPRFYSPNVKSYYT